MAKARYNPLSAFKEDPLAGLKQATAERGTTEPAASVVEDSAKAGVASSIHAVNEEGAAGRVASLRPAPGTALSSAPVKPLSGSLKPSRNTVYLYPEDLTKLRQLSGYASTEHGMRANDSMIVRAALSLVDTDVRFLHALREAGLSDKRRTARSS